ncbi:MAG: hypothetical protein HKN31_05870 [Pricia sp.]|nr:hypothetical protein [Pricia sp.]
MKKCMSLIIIAMVLTTLACRNTSNPNDTGGSEIDEPIRAPYDSGNEPSNTSNSAVTDSSEVDNTHKN